MEEGKAKTHDFIDNPLVGMEIERKAGVAVGQVIISFFCVFILLNDTHYFSIKTREALLVVLVRTRPYIRSFSLQHHTPRNMCGETYHDDGVCLVLRGKCC